MFYQFAVQRFFIDMKVNSGFNFLEFPDIGNKHYFYNINFSFEDKVYKRLSQFVYEDRGEPFIFAMYNRGVLNAVPTQPRQFKASHRNVGALSADLYTVKNVQAQTNICWVSNDPTYLMEFEEYFLMAYDRTKHYQTTYQVPTDYLDLDTVIGVDQGLKKFTLNAEFTLEPLNSLLLINSTGNNGSYTVVSSIIVAGTTEIIVQESINSAIADGIMIKQNTIMEVPATIFLKDIESNQFENYNDQSRGEICFLVNSFNLEYPVIKKENASGGPSGIASSKLIKHISLKIKNVPDMGNLIMNQPYEEINIDGW